MGGQFGGHQSLLAEIVAVSSLILADRQCQGERAYHGGLPFRDRAVWRGALSLLSVVGRFHFAGVVLLPVDLIAMASHGHGGVARLLLGSVTDAVLHTADTPVLLVRPYRGATGAWRASADGAALLIRRHQRRRDRIVERLPPGLPPPDLIGSLDGQRNHPVGALGDALDRLWCSARSRDDASRCVHPPERPERGKLDQTGAQPIVDQDDRAALEHRQCASVPVERDQPVDLRCGVARLVPEGSRALRRAAGRAPGSGRARRPRSARLPPALGRGGS